MFAIPWLIYPRPGIFFDGLDRCSTGGTTFATWHKLERVSAQPWRDYAGAWGDVGFVDTTTGPLGPWHKRFNR